VLHHRQRRQRGQVRAGSEAGEDMKNRRRKNRWIKGSSAVEFAIALPFFIMLVIGVIEFGWYFFVQHTLQYATREGMRLALVGRQLTDGSGNTLSREASIIQTIKKEASLAVKPEALMISIYTVDDSTFADPTSWESQQNAGSPGDYMRVRTRYNHKVFTPLIPYFFKADHFWIVAEGTYRNELYQ
jgi:Flp pilus assembly protein TadG